MTIDEVYLQVSLRVIKDHTDTSHKNIFLYIFSAQFALILHSFPSLCNCGLSHFGPYSAWRSQWERFGADPESFVVYCNVFTQVDPGV